VVGSGKVIAPAYGKRVRSGISRRAVRAAAAPAPLRRDC
jgi:hypothetical protein